jgi:hypothetical protein
VRLLHALALLALIACGESPQDDPKPDDTLPHDSGSETSAGTDADGDGWSVEQGDCDDDDPAVHPEGTERCNGIDDDCDGDVDDDDDSLLGGIEVYTDGDGDGYGAGEAQRACELGSGQVERGGDCDDGDPAVHPEATERPNGVDDDCDGEVDEEECHDGVDNDGDGLLDCEDGDCFEACIEGDACDDGIDNDEDGDVDCQDEDCWDACEQGLITRVRGGRLHMDMRTRELHWSQNSWGGAWAGYARTATLRGTIDSAWGTMQVLSAQRSDAALLTTCTWTVGGGYMSYQGFRSTWDRSAQLAAGRSGLAVQPGCERWADADLLPDELLPFRWGAHGDVYIGRPSYSFWISAWSWYLGTPTTSFHTTLSDTGSSTWKTSYGLAHAWRREVHRTTTAEVELGSSGTQRRSWW